MAVSPTYHITGSNRNRYLGDWRFPILFIELKKIHILYIGFKE